MSNLFFNCTPSLLLQGSVNSSAGSGGSGGATNGQLLPALPKPAVAVAVPLAVGGRSSSASSTSSSSSEHDSQSLLAAPTSAIAQANAASTTTAGQSVLRPGATGGVLVTAPQKSASRDSFHKAMNSSTNDGDISTGAQSPSSFVD